MTSSWRSRSCRVDERCRNYRVRLGLHNHWLGDAWFKGDKALNFEGPADFLKALEGRSEYRASTSTSGTSPPPATTRWPSSATTTRAS